MKLISVSNLSKTYFTPKQEIKSIDNISFDINEKEIISLIGPSGCGKSTFFNILTNNLNYDGKIIFHKPLIIGYMMQEDAILPWLTVYENAILGLKLKDMLTTDNINYVNDLLKKYDLDTFKNDYPKSLSGGMKQRLSLIRTLAIKPNILLLDEPFSKLDLSTRLSITDDVYKIIKDLGITAILISHDIAEAISVSDRIIVLSKRPSKIKKIIKLNKENIPSVRRKDDDFDNLYQEIGALYDE